MSDLSLEAGAPCPRCGQMLQTFTRELPMGLGPRTFTDDCRCEQERRAAEIRQRASEAHEEKVRALLRQSGIGPRH